MEDGKENPFKQTKLELVVFDPVMVFILCPVDRKRGQSSKES